MYPFRVEGRGLSPGLQAGSYPGVTPSVLIHGHGDGTPQTRDWTLVPRPSPTTLVLCHVSDGTRVDTRVVHFRVVLVEDHLDESDLYKEVTGHYDPIRNLMSLVSVLDTVTSCFSSFGSSVRLDRTHIVDPHSLRCLPVTPGTSP